MRHLQSFKYVKAIAQSGSIRGAAEHLTISPSALNRHIQTLELDLDIQIFERLTKGVRLSTEGELFYQFALRQLASFERLQSQINDVKGVRSGMVRFGISADLGLDFLQNKVTQYHAKYPEVSFEIKVVAQGQLENELNSNQIDAALFYQPVVGRNLQVLYSSEVAIHAAVPIGHEINAKDAVKLYDLIDFPAVLPPAGSQMREKLDAACERLGVEMRTRIACSDPFPHLTKSGAGMIAFCLPFAEDFKKYESKGYALKRIASAELMTGYFHVVGGRQHAMPIAPQKFIELIISDLEQSK